MPSEIRESQSVTLTCGLNFSCFGYDILLKWFLEDSEITSITSSVTSITSSVTSSIKNVYTESKLTFQPKWTDHGKSVKCQVQHSSKVLSERTVRLDVKYTPKLEIKVNPTEVEKNNSVTMTCRVNSSNPKLRTVAVSWFKDGRPLEDQELEQEQQMSKLILHSVTKDMRGESPPSTLTVYYSPETIGKRVALGLGFCLTICILAIWGMKIQKKWKQNRSQQGLQENSSGQSFFVRNKKARRTPLSEGPQSQGCYNPAMDDTVSYAILRFPESDTHNTGDAGTPATQAPPPNNSDSVTYSVIQKRPMGDYENVNPSCPEDESIHYSELVQFGAGKRPQAKEDVDYVTLKH